MSRPGPANPVHQDYIARVRYRNDLPPPPLAPKLLDIPGTGLAGGDYTSASYATRLAKEQPLNIEADAELGMPIDLIGIPGIFNDDERAILARPGPSKIHPADKELLKPLSSLGKGAGAGGAVSFLRRTEYTSSQGSQQFQGNAPKDMLRQRHDPKRRKLSMHKDDPLNIIRNIVKGFDVAYPKDAYKGEENLTNIRGAPTTDAEKSAWTAPKHPSNPALTLLDAYPILPDLDALPPSACYLVTKFISNPVASSSSSGLYDPRLDVAILQPKENKQAYAIYEQKNAEYDEATATKPRPLPEDDYDFFLPVDVAAVSGIKRKFDVNDAINEKDPETEDDDLYTHEFTGQDGAPRRAFKYTRLRTYETYNQNGDPENFYDDSVALALHDVPPSTSSSAGGSRKNRLPKGAYFYPVIQRTALRPKRNVGAMAASQAVDGEEKIDEVNLVVREWDAEEWRSVMEKRAGLDSMVKVPEAVEGAA